MHVIQVIREYEDDIVIDGDEGDSSADDFFADEVEYSLRSLGVSAAEMRHVLLSAPATTESSCAEVMERPMFSGRLASPWPQLAGGCRGCMRELLCPVSQFRGESWDENNNEV